MTYIKAHRRESSRLFHMTRHVEEGGYHNALLSMQYRVGCPREVRVLERQTRLSRLALFEMQHLLRIFGLVSGRANARRCDRIYATSDEEIGSGDAASKIPCREFIGSFLPSLIRPSCRRVDGGSMGVEGKQQRRLIAIEFWFQPLERFCSDEERPFHRTVMSPESYGVSSRIIDPALVREIEHLGADLC